jgi:hypothetical protein
MNLCLATVPGTGTRFFNELLSQYFPKTSFEDGGLTTLHVNDDLLERIEKVNPFIVTTWRPYEHIEKTLKNRDFSPMERLPKHWDAWKRLVIRFAPEVVTIEKDFLGIPREDCLERLGEKLGVDLETDWVPVR